MGETALLDAGGDQHLRALQHANRVRLARAGMKREIAAGELAVVDVVVSCPWQAYSMEVGDLLMSQKRLGTGPLPAAAGVSRRAGEQGSGKLTERQRIALARALLARERSLDGPAPVSSAPCRASELENPGEAHSSGTMPGPAVASSTMWPSGSRR